MAALTAVVKVLAAVMVHLAEEMAPEAAKAEAAQREEGRSRVSAQVRESTCSSLQRSRHVRNVRTPGCTASRHNLLHQRRRSRSCTSGLPTCPGVACQHTAERGAEGVVAVMAAPQAVPALQEVTVAAQAEVAVRMAVGESQAAD
jgi:hypothetical protein